MSADLPPDVRDRASEAARKVDRDYGHWQDWVGSIDEFEHERALSTVDAVTSVVAPEIARPLQARIEELEADHQTFWAKKPGGVEMWEQHLRNLVDGTDEYFEPFAMEIAVAELNRQRARIEELSGELSMALEVATRRGGERDAEIAHSKQAAKDYNATFGPIVRERDALQARVEELEEANAAVEEENDLLRDVIQQKHARVEVLTAALTRLNSSIARDINDIAGAQRQARAALAAGTTESEAPCTCEPLWTGEAPPVPDRHCPVHGEGT